VLKAVVRLLHLFCLWCLEWVQTSQEQLLAHLDAMCRDLFRLKDVHPCVAMVVVHCVDRGSAAPVPACSLKRRDDHLD
jgi:hypothetical protein